MDDIIDEIDCTESLRIVIYREPEATEEEVLGGEPRLGTIVTFNARLNEYWRRIGDSHEWRSLVHFRDHISGIPHCKLPVFVNEHREMYQTIGVEISLEPFGIPHTSGMVGWIYTTEENADEYFRRYDHTFDDDSKEEFIKEILVREFRDYKDFWDGNVFSYAILLKNPENGVYEDVDYGGSYTCLDMLREQAEEQAAQYIEDEDDTESCSVPAEPRCAGTLEMPGLEPEPVGT